MAVDPVSIAITAALIAAQMGLQAMQKIEGPRLEDMKVSVADYGTPISHFWGTRRLEWPFIYSEDIREVKRRRKTKGGKYNDYTYFGTWACLVAGHECEAVKTIMFDRHLVYDATGAGPLTPFDSGDTFDVTEHIRIYLGTETQECDPRMLATIEARHGAGSCSAYRGRTYVMFEEVPLEKVGNRVPQCGGVATRAAVPAFPYESFTPATQRSHRLHGASFSPDGTRFLWGEDGLFEMWDLPSRSLIAAGNFPSGVNAVQDVFGVSNDGAIYAVESEIGDFGGIKIFTPDVGGFSGSVPLVDVGRYCQVIGLSSGDQYCCVSAEVTTTIQYMSLQDSLGVVGIDVDWIPTQYARDPDDNIWVVGGEFTGGGGAGDAIHLRCIVGDRAGEDHEITAPVAHVGLPEFYLMHNGDGGFLVYHHSAGRLYLIDDATFAITDSRTITLDVFNSAKQFAACPVGAKALWTNVSGTVHEISTRTLDDIRTVDPDDWKVENVDGVIYTSILHALICFPQFDDIMTIRYLDRVGSGVVTLRSIVEEVATLCGLDPGDIDASDLTQEVIGYSITQGTGAAAIERLLEIYDCDARPHGFQQQFIRRGDDVVATIDSSEFVSAGGSRFDITIRQDTQLPASATLSFADPAADQQTNTVLVRRDTEASDGVGEVAVNLTGLVLDVDEARQLAERYFRRQWNGREQYKMALPPKRLAIEPADVYGFLFDGTARKARDKKLTIGGKNLLLKGEWERDHPLLAGLASTTGATSDGFVPAEMLILQLTKGLVIDASLAADVDDQSSPFLYFGAAPYGSGFWPQADIFVSEDGSADSYDTVWATVASGESMHWGACLDTLGDAAWNVIDNGNSLSVRMRNGTLTSSTEAAILEDDSLNQLLIGADGRWEYVQFISAVLESDGSYTLSGFIRGARGTEHAISSHATGDAVFVPATRKKRAMGASDIGDEDFYRAVTQGRSEASAFPQSVAFSAEANRPYSPVNADCEKDSGSGDWSITADRRTRIGAANVDGGDVPLGETAERWELDILDGGDVVRTLTGPSLPLTYYDYQQVEDFGATVAEGDLDCNLYQISPALSLRGHPLAIAA